MIKKILGVITTLAVVGAIVMVVLEHKGYSSMLPQSQKAQTTATTATAEQQAKQDTVQVVETPAEQNIDEQADRPNEQPSDNEQTKAEE